MECLSEVLIIVTMSTCNAYTLFQKQAVWHLLQHLDNNCTVSDKIKTTCASVYDKLPTVWHSILVHHAQFLYMSTRSLARSTRWLSSRCPAGLLRVCAPLLLPLWQSLSRCWWYRGGLGTNPLWFTAGEPAGWSLFCYIHGMLHVTWWVIVYYGGC